MALSSDQRERFYHLEGDSHLDRVSRTIPLSVLRSLEIREGRILDLGCSFGNTTVELAAIYGPRVTVEGIDLNERWVGRGADDSIRYYNGPPELFPDRPNGLYPVTTEQVTFRSGDGFVWARQHTDSYEAVFVLNNLLYSVAWKGLDPRTLSRLLSDAKMGVKSGGWLCVGAEELLHSPFLIFRKEGKKLVLRYHNGKELAQPTAALGLADEAISAANAIYVAAGV